MNNSRWIDMRLKIRHFFRKYKRIIIVSIVIWLVIIAVNYILKNMDFAKVPYTTYEPNKAVMDDSKVPTRLQEPISNIIDTFISECNNKEYEKAYELIADDCRKAKFSDSIDNFKEYVNTNFSTKKVHNIQDFSNLNDIYIYNVKILDDIMATGMTDSGYSFYEEKFVIRDTKEGLKLSILGYVATEEMNVLAQDDNMRVKVLSKIINYDNEQYELEITNRTSNYIILYDGSVSNEIEINIGDQNRQMITENREGIIKISPMEKTNIKVSFTKFADDGRTTKELKFNAIRILGQYSIDETQRENDIQNAKDKYSLSIDLDQ